MNSTEPSTGDAVLGTPYTTCSVCCQGPIVEGEPCSFCQRAANADLAARMTKLEARLAELEKGCKHLLDELTEVVGASATLIRERTAFADDLRAYFGPLIDGKKPPIDGEEIATKKFVQAELQRVSMALREHAGRTYQPKAPPRGRPK